MIFDFLKLSERELFEIWKSANAYEWNELLGPKPDGFDSLPIHGGIKNRRCRSNYTRPIWAAVFSLLGATKIRKLLYEEKSSFEKAAQILSEHAEPGSKRKSLEPILEHFSKILDS